MVFFLADGGIVFGISIPVENSARVDQISRRLQAWFETDKVIITYEELPPESMDAFDALFQSLPEATGAAGAPELGAPRAHKPTSDRS